MPQKAQHAIAQMHASNGSERIRVVFNAQSMGTVIGGRMGCECLPKRFCRPRSDQSICLWFSTERGSGQPWAMCQAQIPARYFLAVVIDTGSKWVLTMRDVSSDEGSVTTHRAKE